MSALRDWARLDARWYEDPVLRACAKTAPAAFVMWPVLVAMAKAQSHVDDNPEGLIRVSMDDIARACCVTSRRAIAALDALAEGDFVTVDAHRVGVLCIRLKSFAKWQSPRKSRAEQAANRRVLASIETEVNQSGFNCSQVADASGDCIPTSVQISREKYAMRGGDVAIASPSRHPSGAPDRDVDRDVDEEPDDARDSGQAPTESAIIDRVAEVLASACVPGTEPSYFAGNLETRRWAMPGEPAEVLLRAAQRVVLRQIETKRPFKPDQAWQSLEVNIAKVKRGDGVSSLLDDQQAAKTASYHPDDMAAVFAASGDPGSKAVRRA